MNVQDVIDDAARLHGKWDRLVAELGYDDKVTWAEFPRWSEENTVDLEPYVARFTDEVLIPHRPN